MAQYRRASAPDGSVTEGRNNNVSALFDFDMSAVQITAQAVIGRFRCLTVVAPDLSILSVMPAPE